jgi:hypothetical protein
MGKDQDRILDEFVDALGIHHIKTVPVKSFHENLVDVESQIENTECKEIEIHQLLTPTSLAYLQKKYPDREINSMGLTTKEHLLENFIMLFTDVLADEMGKAMGLGGTNTDKDLPVIEAYAKYFEKSPMLQIINDLIRLQQLNNYGVKKKEQVDDWRTEPGNHC